MSKNKFNIDKQLNDNDGNNNDRNIDNNLKIENKNDFLIMKKEFKLKTKVKPVQFYLTDNMVNSLDMLCKQTGKKRNDIVIELLNFAINKTKVVD